MACSEKRPSSEMLRNEVLRPQMGQVGRTLTVSDWAGFSMVLGALIRLRSWAFLHWSADRFRRGYTIWREMRASDSDCTRKKEKIMKHLSTEEHSDREKWDGDSPFHGERIPPSSFSEGSHSPQSSAQAWGILCHWVGVTGCHLTRNNVSFL